MKVLKKLVLGTALLLACSFGFAQEAETSKKSSAIKGMYAGMQMGGGVVPGFSSMEGGSVGFFEITPYFGMYLSDSLPDLALEFDLQMDFCSQTYYQHTLKVQVISPQLLAAYTFNLGKVNPFIKAGAGLNFLGGSYINTNLDAKLSASFVLNPGVNFKINDKAILSFYTRFNLNDFQEFNKPVINKGISCSTRSLGVGFDYHF